MADKLRMIEKIKAHDMMKFENGKLDIMGILGFAIPLNTLIFQHKTLVDTFDEKKVDDIYYFSGRNQGRMAAKLMDAKFGFKSPELIIENSIGQIPLIGDGIIEKIRIDVKNNSFVFRNNVTPYAKHFSKLYGLSEKPLNAFTIGLLAGIMEYAVKKDLVGLETQCVSSGKPYCIFEIKPLDKWDDKMKPLLPVETDIIKKNSKIILDLNSWFEPKK